VQVTGVDGVEPHVVDEAHDELLGGIVVGGHGQGQPARRSRGTGIVLEAPRDDRVERLDHPRAGQLLGHPLAGRRLAAVQHGDLAVALRVVVVGVDHDPPAEALARQLRDRAQRDRHERGRAVDRGLLRRPGARALAQ
jgi:hypothetical protein